MFGPTKVLHISKTTNDKWMVFLWDGTDAPPISIYNNGILLAQLFLLKGWFFLYLCMELIGLLSLLYDRKGFALLLRISSHIYVRVSVSSLMTYKSSQKKILKLKLWCIIMKPVILIQCDTLSCLCIKKITSLEIYKWAIELEDELHNPLPLHFEPLPPSRDVLCTFPTVGTILRVILDVDCVTYILQLLKVDQWMKFFHVFCKMHEGLWYGVFTSSSMIRDMPNDDILIFERQSNCDQRSLGELDRMPYWSCPWPSKITEVKRIDVPFSTLMDVLTCKKLCLFVAWVTFQETNNFRCVVRFVAVIPWRVEDFRAPCGAYRVRFTLEDPTARIHAYAHAENGEEFFNCSSTDALKRKVIKLIGVPVSRDGEAIMGGARNPPWVQCYLKSNPIKQRHWIFETKLLG
ncbi:protection of telomeres protein 1b-like isoform X2 [Gossypium australe]|uniref:Protection of telomeres protein 1b-like isoform X2 n=1 Tax=Gossypium australe TaxID=47621 RepID=A0A5B6UUD2_9ROSI|nr:protection of telomeres protein 1b-like isoform X2 [Gossypium australe]